MSENPRQQEDTFHITVSLLSGDSYSFDFSIHKGFMALQKTLALKHSELVTPEKVRIPYTYIGFGYFEIADQDPVAFDDLPYGICDTRAVFEVLQKAFLDTAPSLPASKKTKKKSKNTDADGEAEKVKILADKMRNNVDLTYVIKPTRADLVALSVAELFDKIDTEELTQPDSAKSECEVKELGADYTGKLKNRFTSRVGHHVGYIDMRPQQFDSNFGVRQPIALNEILFELSCRPLLILKGPQSTQSKSPEEEVQGWDIIINCN